MQANSKEVQKKQRNRPHSQPYTKDSANTKSHTKRNDSVLYTPFSDYGVGSFWHLTHRENIPGILNHGILSNSTVYSSTSTIEPVDISDNDVQNLRDRVDPHFNRKIHQYAPLYISIRNPMLFSRKEMQSELCLVEVSLAALDGKEFLVSNGNAASRDTEFFKSYSDLKFLPWDVLRADFWTEFEDGKRKKCSEVLVYPKVEPEDIERIHCYSDDTTMFLRASVGFSRVGFTVSTSMFF